MRHTKSILAIGITLLILTGTLPALAAVPQSAHDDENTAIQAFFDHVDTAAATSHSLREFLGKLYDLCCDKTLDRFPLLKDLASRIITLCNKHPLFSLFGLPLGSGASGRPGHFVISFGVYHRYNPLKQNTLSFMKERISLWHYRSQTNAFKGRTLILDRHPFGIGQRLLGPQVGFMRGFRGVYWDHESKLTGNSYLFFMGNADRIRAFDLTPFK